MGGTPKRMEQFAYKLMEEISYKIPTGTTLQDISRFSYRYSMYKVGPVLCISVSINIVKLHCFVCVHCTKASWLLVTRLRTAVEGKPYILNTAHRTNLRLNWRKCKTGKIHPESRLWFLYDFNRMTNVIFETTRSKYQEDELSVCYFFVWHIPVYR